MAHIDRHIELKRHNESRIEYMGNTYKIYCGISDFAVSLVVGDVDVCPLFDGTYCGAEYKIEDSVLILKSFICLIDAEYEDKIKREYRDKMKISHIKRSFLKDGRLVFREVSEIVCDKLNLPCPYSGMACARQYYPDEVEDFGKMHSEEDLFVFSDGILDIHKSRIACRNELFITQFVWQDGKDRHTRSGAYSSQNGKVFFLDPIGSYLQQDGVFARYINYLVSRSIKKELIDDLLLYKKPVLRSEMVFQKSADKDEYEKRVLDLPLLAIRFLDHDALFWMYDYIQFDDYPRYPEWMLDELFTDLYEKTKEYGASSHIRILELLSSKSLKCKNAEKFILKLKEERTLTEKESEKIVELLEKLRHSEEAE